MSRDDKRKKARKLTYMPTKFRVWVVELGILDVTGHRIAYWEEWNSHNSKDEAETWLRNQLKVGKLGRKNWRIRKYIPSDDVLRGKEKGLTR